MRKVRWEAQAADGTWESGVEKVETTDSLTAINLMCEMLWSAGYVGSYDVEVVG